MKKWFLCFILIAQMLLIAGCPVNSIETSTETDSSTGNYCYAINEIPPTLDLETAEKTIYIINQNVIEAMRDKNFIELQRYIHPASGVRISLFNMVSTTDVILSRDDLLSNQEHFWGLWPGCGERIEMSFGELFDTILWNRDYSQYAPIFNPVELSAYHSQALGNAYMFYDEFIAVLHLYEGNDEWQRMDWSGLKLIYQQYLDGNWYLAGIIYCQRRM